MESNEHLVIMAGGVGARFWPVSSEDMPKQFLDILGCGRTLIQLTYDRFMGICPPENVWVVTSERYYDVVREQLPELPHNNILCEPERRNTAPCIAYVSWKIKRINPKANIVVAPSDHYIRNVEAFRSAIQKAMLFTAETDAIVTLGIEPTHPETGYGYIEADLTCSSSRNAHIYRVDSFREKPALEVAQAYLKEDNYYWNSGIFIWSVSTIVNAFRVYQPDMARIFEQMQSVFGTPQEAEVLAKEFPKCENISVDYAIMEKAEEIFVHPVSFGWSDLGTWGSLKTHLDKDQYDNAVVGADVSLFESSHNMVYTPGLKKVVLQGLDGYVVVEKEGTLLVCKLSEEQRIKLFH